VIEIDDNLETDQIEKTSENIAQNKKNQVKTNKSIKIIISECFQWMKIYLQKFGGLHEKRPRRVTWDEYFWSFIGSLVSITLIAILHYRLLQE
jgi:hypothetical protein